MAGKSFQNIRVARVLHSSWGEGGELCGTFPSPSRRSYGLRFCWLQDSCSGGQGGCGGFSRLPGVESEGVEFLAPVSPGIYPSLSSFLALRWDRPPRPSGQRLGSVREKPWVLMTCLFPDCGLHDLTVTGMGLGRDIRLEKDSFLLCDFTFSSCRGKCD